MTELRTGRIHIALDGPLLVGGHTPPPSGFHAATARSEAGVLIPASALKGAIREAVWRRARTEWEERLTSSEEKRATREAVKPVCEPWQPWKERKSGCDVNPCRICRIFGAPGADRPGVVDSITDTGRTEPTGTGWGTEGLRLTDARPEPDAEVPTGARFGVAIDRVTGHAAPDRLFRREVAEGHGAALVACFRARLTPEDFEYLRETLALVDSIGNSRTRGYGRVRLTLEQDDEVESVAGLSLPEGALDEGYARVVVDALEPLHFGRPPLPGSTRGTERFIAGGALLGALIGGLLRIGEPTEVIEQVAALSLSDLWPAEPSSAAISTPFPRTAGLCRCGQEVDRTLLGALVRRQTSSGGTLDALDAALLDEGERCPACGPDGDIKPRRGVLGGEPPRIRLVTRLALDPHTSSFAHGMLYAREQIEPGQRFTGSAAGLTPAVLTALRRLAASGEPLQVGGLRNRGLGGVRIQFEPWTDTLGVRVASFQRRAGGFLRAHPVQDWQADRLLFVVARTPLAVSGPVEAALGEALFGDSAHRPLATWQRWTSRSGWDARKRRPRDVRPVVRPGSCWLFLAPASLPDLASLRRLEVDGLGADEDRRLGLGRLHFFPDLISRSTP
ncbi:MAG: hypothetical protein H6739_35775 [Alphaproteobacteria bacterium]|nr:hypothetical protein [Alphaproteobacteria bacterium]